MARSLGDLRADRAGEIAVKPSARIAENKVWWEQGVRDSIAAVEYRIRLTDWQAKSDKLNKAYKAALRDVLVHLQALLERKKP